MTATDKLRELLDERGVKYETYIELPTGFEHVKWNFNKHGSADFNLEFGEPWLTMYGTISGPEQAIAATLGAGTCHNEDMGKYFVCSECGAHVQLHDIGRSYVDESGKRWYATSHEHGLNYCPNCGRKVVD